MEGEDGVASSVLFLGLVRRLQRQGWRTPHISGVHSPPRAIRWVSTVWAHQPRLPLSSIRWSCAAYGRPVGVPLVGPSSSATTGVAALPRPPVAPRLGLPHTCGHRAGLAPSGRRRRRQVADGKWLAIGGRRLVRRAGCGGGRGSKRIPAAPHPSPSGGRLGVGLRAKIGLVDLGGMGGVGQGTKGERDAWSVLAVAAVLGALCEEALPPARVVCPTPHFFSHWRVSSACRGQEKETVLRAAGVRLGRPPP